MGPVSSISATSVRASFLSRSQATFWLLIGGICLLSVLLPGPHLLGEWESLSVFTIFGAQFNDMAFVVTRFANIGGQGYPLLEVSRHLVEWLRLPYTIDFIRLPVKLLGAGGLVAFAIVTRRWFGAWPALAATALLAVNPIYHQYQNELIIAGPSLFVFIVLVERLQQLSRTPGSWVGWVTMALLWALLLTMYGPSRIYSTVLVVTWLVLATYRALRHSNYLSIGSLALRGCVSFVLVPLVLLLAYPGNLRYFNRQMFFPKAAETALVEGSLQGLIGAITTNVRVVLESLIPVTRGDYHSSFVEATLIQGRYPTIPLYLSPIVLTAFALVIWQAWALRHKGMNPYLAIVGLAALTSIPPLTSSIFTGETGLNPSLVNHRLAFFLLPAYLAIGSVVAYFASKGRWWRTSTAVLAAGLAFAGLAQMIIGHANFVARAAAADPNLAGEPGQSQWLSGYGFGGKGVSQGSHFQQHEQYARWADEAAGAVAAQPDDSILVVATSISCFPEAPLTTQTLKELDRMNFHGMFLGMYLANALNGEAVGYVNLPSAQAREATIMLKWGVFSGPLAVSPDGTIDYASPDLTSSRIMTYGSTKPKVLVSTTPTELEAARSLLDDQNLPYQVVDKPLPCWGSN